MVHGGFGVLLEMQIFDFLPACHHAGATPDSHGTPLLVKVAVVDGADVSGLAGEGGQVVAFGGVVVVCHGVAEAADDGFGDI